MKRQPIIFKPVVVTLLMVFAIALPVTGQSSAPSNMPVAAVTDAPVTSAPTAAPTGSPVTDQPTRAPSAAPTSAPTKAPTASPSMAPTKMPTKNPTASPSKTPTSAPTKMPSPSPSKAPTASPTKAPTSRPSDKPSANPTNQPTASPTAQPSPSPSEQPSVSPTKMPSAAPTNGPTSLPSIPPTLSPVFTPRPTRAPVITASPSSEPSEPPSNSPTAAPTGKPSTRPSTSPSASPSPAPTNTPSSMPTMAPIIGTAAPVTPAPVTPAPVTPAPTTGAPVITDSPSSAPSTVPPATLPPVPTDSPTTAAPSVMPSTSFPSAGPTLGFTMDEITGLRMELFGVTVDDFTPESQTEFAEVTAFHAEAFFEMRPDLDVENLSTQISVTGITSGSGGDGDGRKLQTPSVLVIYNQQMDFQSSNPAVDAEFITTQPFAEEESRDEYTTLLATSDDPGLSQVEGVSEVTVPTESPVETPTDAPEPMPTESPTPEDDGGDGGDDGGGISTGAIIGIAAGGGVVLIACLLYNFCSSGGSGGDLVDPQNEQLDTFIVKDAGADEISTLGPPAGLTDHVNRFGGGYENQSVGTIDQIYSDAYASGGESMVSSSGGTFGSNTHGLSTNLDPDSAARDAALGAAPHASASDTDSFEGQYNTPGGLREEVINVIAPPGKLGVVIDTPDDGAPVVHAVKDSSVIAHLVQVGDLLVAVDDEDVREMTAIKVSKLISRKSANPSRKLTIVRKTVG